MTAFSKDIDLSDLPGNPAEELFADVAAIIAGGLEPERPSVAFAGDAGFLLYAGRINEIHGEPSTGKTNISLALAGTIIASGGTVLYVDPEDSATSAIRRLICFGMSEAELIRGFKHVASPTPGQLLQLGEWAGINKPTLVVVDGIAETLSGLGLDEDKPSDFLGFCHTYLVPFTTSGAAVLVSDHVVKNAEGRGRWARGTGAKLGRYDGAVYSVELGEAYSPTKAGFVRLKVSKDRNGGVAPFGTTVAEIHFKPTDEGTAIQFKRPAQSDRFIPTGIMEKISRHLEIFPNASKRDLRGLGKSQFVDQAIDELVRGGFLTAVSVPRKSSVFTLNKPYREKESVNES